MVPQRASASSSAASSPNFTVAVHRWVAGSNNAEHIARYGTARRSDPSTSVRNSGSGRPARDTTSMSRRTRSAVSWLIMGSTLHRRATRAHPHIAGGGRDPPLAVHRNTTSGDGQERPAASVWRDRAPPPDPTRRRSMLPFLIILVGCAALVPLQWQRLRPPGPRTRPRP